jgi:shikimate kinase
MQSESKVLPTNSKPHHIILVGLMGAGKTSVGKTLARLMGKSFCDSDQEIERLTGVKIPLIFEIEGESGFRLRETKVLAELLDKEAMVLATGGGAILAQENRERMSSAGIVIYLRAPVSALVKRTRRDPNRPLLQGVDPKEKLTRLFEQRDPLYREIAHIVVDTADQSVRLLASQIQSLLEAPQENGMVLK